MRRTVQWLRLTGAEPRNVCRANVRVFVLTEKSPCESSVIQKDVRFLLSNLLLALSVSAVGADFPHAKKNKTNVPLLFSFQASVGIAYANAKHTLTLPLM